MVGFHELDNVEPFSNAQSVALKVYRDNRLVFIEGSNDLLELVGLKKTTLKTNISKRAFWIFKQSTKHFGCLRIDLTVNQTEGVDGFLFN